MHLPFFLEVKLLFELSILEQLILLNLGFSWQSPVYQRRVIFLGALQHAYLHCTRLPISPPMQLFPSSSHTYLPSSRLLAALKISFPAFSFTGSFSKHLFFSPSPDLLRILESNAERLRASRLEFFYFLLLFFVNLDFSILISKSDKEQQACIFAYWHVSSAIAKTKVSEMPWKCDGHAIFFEFKQNSFHVHVLTYSYRFAIISFFCPLLSNFIFYVC